MVVAVAAPTMVVVVVVVVVEAQEVVDKAVGAETGDRRGSE